MFRRRSRLPASGLAALLLTAAVAVTACAGGSDDEPQDPSPAPTATAPAGDVPVPTVVGRISGGTPDLPVNAMPAELRERFDYTETEFAIEGTARSFTPAGPLGEDGRWAVEPAGGERYRTRLLVRAPADPAAFNGTVLVEWLNVSAGRDADPEFGFGHEALLRAGAAYVGVSAQAVGVVGGDNLVPIEGYDPRSLVEEDPQRYAGLTHPGDDYSYDIFSQAAAAILFPKGPAPLGELRPRRLIAAGESQSAMRMVTYVNAVAPLAKIFDGYVIHSRGPSGAPLVGAQADRMPARTIVRTDTAVPVMIVQTEGDLFGLLSSFPARQEDSDNIVTWEIAGAAHADRSTTEYGRRSARMPEGASGIAFETLCGQINDGPHGPVLRAALSAVMAWVADGTRPPAAQPLQVVDGRAIARDEFGNALGGVRHPDVDVPIATHSGEARPDAGIICLLFGSTTPFDAARLAELYPTRDDYVDRVTRAADAAVEAGFLLSFDRDAAVEKARRAPVPA